MNTFSKRGSHYRKPPLWKKILIWTAISVVAIALAIGLAGFIFVYHTLGKIGEDTEVIYEAKQQLDVPLPDEPKNILVLGTDEDPDGTNKRSDTIMLVRVDPANESISILSFPRDLIVDIPGYGQDKINTAYAVGGTSLAIETIRDLTEQPVHDFVLMDYTGFEEAVDALGGVYVDVDRRYFNDNSDAMWEEAYEPIDIDPGYQRLSGSDALAYVRYRHTDNDFMRIARQQYFISDVKSQTLTWGNVTMIPEVADAFASHTTSDIGRSDLLSLTKFILSIKRDRIFQAQVPVLEKIGGPAGSYVALDKKEFPKAIENFLSPVVEDQAAAGGDQPASSPPPLSPATKQASIEVINGNGVEGDAARAAELLQKKGFTNIEVGGNANNKYHENEVYFQYGQDAAAQELCGQLDPCLSGPVPSNLTTSAQLVVVVGSAFAAEPDQPDGELAAVKPPLTFDDSSPYDIEEWDDAGIELPFDIWKPATFPEEFEYVDFHVYDIDTGEKQMPSLKVVCQNEEGHYWGITESTFTEAPLLESPSMEKEISGKKLKFYYVGDNLRYLAWQEDNVVLWITNSLQNSLSEDTMVKIALSFERD
jgi:LCP family protein required for cell wall assembly